MIKGSKKKSAAVIRKQFRFTAKEWHRIKWLARTYAGGNVSKWVRHSALNADRRFLK